MALDWEQVIVKAKDPAALGHWWAEALGWHVSNDSPNEFEINPEPDTTPGLLFVPVSEPKDGPNRLHLDFRPDDHEAEVARFEARGAVRVDTGAPDDAPWVTFVDPEGNEFCVLRAFRSQERAE